MVLNVLVDLVQLRTFVAVAEEQHLTRASERLHISQSAASGHVRAVEESLDTILFVRTNRSLELTQAGHLLLRHAKELLDGASKLHSYARELKGKADGKLTIGTNPDPKSNRIGDIVHALRSASPRIEVDLQSRSSTGTRLGLKTGELDAGLLLGRPTDLAFEYLVLATVRYRIIGPASWRDRIESADWAELAALPWVTPDDSGMAYARMLDEMFGVRGLELNVAAKTDSDPLARAMVHAGVGVTLVREQRAVEGERDGTFCVSPIARAEFNLLAAHMNGRGDDPLIKAFMDAVREVFPEAARVP